MNVVQEPTGPSASFSIKQIAAWTWVWHGHSQVARYRENPDRLLQCLLSVLVSELQMKLTCFSCVNSLGTYMFAVEPETGSEADSLTLSLIDLLMLLFSILAIFIFGFVCYHWIPNLGMIWVLLDNATCHYISFKT